MLFGAVRDSFGPLTYLSASSVINPYIQYFGSAAARELFEFQVS